MSKRVSAGLVKATAIGAVQLLAGAGLMFFPYSQKLKLPSQAYVQLYLGEQWFCSEKEAQKAGFSQAPRCQ